MKLLFILALLFYPGTSQESFFMHRLPSIDNSIFDFQQLKKKNGTVLIFMLADCPACQSYTLTLNQMSKKFESKGIQFIGIFPGQYGTPSEMLEFKKNYAIDFPLVLDREMKLARSVGAVIAPETFLLDSTGTTIYSGRIDDWMYALGKKRQVIRSRDLENAITSYIQHKKIKVKKTDAIGCILNYE
jgi:peroxiredoxin